MTTNGGIVANSSILLLFYVLRCLVLNLIMLMPLVITVEVIMLLVILARLCLKRYRTQKNLVRSVVHIACISSVFLFIGDWCAVFTLSVVHHRTISIFTKYQEQIPVGDRVNGAWILEEPDFMISDEEKNILATNYARWSPCFYERGYCYVEFGGFLRNAGGYCLRLDAAQETCLRGFGFHRITITKPLIGGWRRYE
ncbi:hypothetical protein SAMN05421823_109134 [Catalinimonas alkaloidigena]|uniref:Uncharacterized protein n=1 Tax=Catalinimonas alkaloidigena TaxID=1075417 RepID=A0A1G9PBD5_9BACT|nr:hypothetical protein SAMN05421823_109134 [Catalinimonas alkaloidigena]